MARPARLIDQQKIIELKERLRDSEYILIAVHAIAYRLTHTFFEELPHRRHH